MSLTASSSWAEIRYYWLDNFTKLEEHGPLAFSYRQLHGLYAVSSICYYKYGWSPITDPCFDQLCQYMLTHFDECVEAGASFLEKGMLAAGSGYDMTRFVGPYHTVAERIIPNDFS